MLPFGLRSAPQIFNALADALEWVLRSAGIQHVFHYLDDFIILGTPSSSQCESDFHRFRITCEHLGVPLAPHMLVGPTTELMFLGINIDTVTGQLSLPRDKLTRLTCTLEEWGDHRYCSCRQLESLVGKLHHASKVVHPRRCFLRRMLDLLKGRPVRRSYALIRLNTSFRAHLEWWRTFLHLWNGILYLPPPEISFEVTSDTLGCGAWSDINWFQL